MKYHLFGLYNGAEFKSQRGDNVLQGWPTVLCDSETQTPQGF
jgi:hypothetical protein